MASRPFLQNLIGNRWVTEKEIDNIFNILSNKFVNTFCLVNKPDQYMDDTLKAKKDQFMCSKYKERVLIALFVANGLKNGNHWTLLVLDIQSHTAYYCDSLGWNVPQNLLHSHLVV